MTYAGKPLYRHSGDRGALELHGDVTDLWGTWSMVVVPAASPGSFAVRFRCACSDHDRSFHPGSDGNVISHGSASSAHDRDQLPASGAHDHPGHVTSGSLTPDHNPDHNHRAEHGRHLLLIP